MFTFKDFYEKIMHDPFFDDLPIFLSKPPDTTKYENFALLELSNQRFEYIDFFKTQLTTETSFNLNIFYSDDNFIMEKIKSLQDVFNDTYEYYITMVSLLPVPGSFFDGKNCYAITIIVK